MGVIGTMHLDHVSELHVLAQEGVRLTGDQMAILSKDRISLQASAADKLDAIRKAGELLVNSGCVLPEYVDGLSLIHI